MCDAGAQSGSCVARGGKCDAQVHADAESAQGDSCVRAAAAGEHDAQAESAQGESCVSAAGAAEREEHAYTEGDSRAVSAGEHDAQAESAQGESCVSAAGAAEREEHAYTEGDSRASAESAQGSSRAGTAGAQSVSDMPSEHKVSAAELQKLKPDHEAKHDTGIQLKKELGLLDGVAIIVGVIIGAGIFVSPKGVLRSSGSIGLGLGIWILSGVLSMIGALCYAELGTMIPKSGGDYAYISEAFGPLPAFLYLWVALLVIVPTGNAITALTFAQYILQPLWPACEPPYEAVRLLAAVITCLLTAINCYNVKWATRVQDIFTATKILALVVIVLAGAWVLVGGDDSNIRQPFEGTNTEPGYIALSFYSGLFSYAGWNFLNFVTEELKDPDKNLPRAICISLPLVTLIYVLVNISYYVVLTKEELLSSNAVAVTFGDKLLGWMSWTMPFFVACSTFGALNGAIFASARLFFVGAREGHLPKAIALINYERFTPVPSLVFLCIVTVGLLVIKDVYVLINYVSFVEALFTLFSISGLLWLRLKRPHMKRSIKVPIVLPIIFFIICAFLVVLPCYVKPWEVGVALIIIFSGIPVYYIFIHWKNKPSWLENIADTFNFTCAKMFMCVLSEEVKTD